jgi:hypothetical protein
MLAQKTGKVMYHFNKCAGHMGSVDAMLRVAATKLSAILPLINLLLSLNNTWMEIDGPHRTKSREDPSSA